MGLAGLITASLWLPGTSNNFITAGLEAIQRVRNEGFKVDYWFEGTQFFDQLTDGPSSSYTEVGFYEIHLQDYDNLKYVLIEDEYRGAYIFQRPLNDAKRQPRYMTKITIRSSR